MRRKHNPPLAVVSIFVLLLAACTETARLPFSATVGRNPTIPPPARSPIPMMLIAPALGWPAGEKPVGAPGTTVTAFAANLDHPRWLHVLPNGDVLVAETNAPPRPEDNKGLKGWVKKKVMKRAGATVPVRTESHCCVMRTAMVSPKPEPYFWKVSTRLSAWRSWVPISMSPTLMP